MIGILLYQVFQTNQDSFKKLQKDFEKIILWKISNSIELPRNLDDDLEYTFEYSKINLTKQKISSLEYGAIELLRIFCCLYNPNQQTLFLDEALRCFHPKWFRSILNILSFSKNKTISIIVHSRESLDFCIKSNIFHFRLEKGKTKIIILDKSISDLYMNQEIYQKFCYNHIQVSNDLLSHFYLLVEGESDFNFILSKRIIQRDT